MTRSLGFTLLELIVTLAVLSVSAGMTLLALRPAEVTQEAVLQDRINRASEEAIRTGMSVRIVVEGRGTGSTDSLVLLLPDGSAIGHGIDPWTGALRARE